MGVAVQKGWEARVAIVKNESEYKDVLRKIQEFQPQIVGFSSVSSQFVYVKRIAELIKQDYPAATIICGGVHPTISPYSIKDAPGIDVFFVGESEVAFGEFLDRVQQGEDYHVCDNCAYVKDGEVVINRLKPLLKDLDSLPFPDKDVYPYNESVAHHGIAPFMFSRGCPYQCTYCSNHAIASVYGKTRNEPRFRSVDLCMKEMEMVIEKYHPEKIYIMDDIFGLNKKWRHEFCEQYQKRIRLPFICILRVEVVSEEFIKELKESGCIRVQFGVESGSEYVRKKLMNRHMTNEQIIKAFKLCQKYGLETNAINLIGIPGETEPMIWETINLNRTLKPTSSGVNIFYPYKGTVLGDQCFRDDLVDLAKYNDSLRERRESVIKYPEEYHKKLRYYYDNWDVLVNPFDIRARIKRILDKIGLLETARSIRDRLAK